MKNYKNLLALAVLLLTLPVSGAFAAGGGGDLKPSGANINDLGSLQRGAQLFMNYCMGCHSAEYMRYNRLAEDLELGEDMVMRNLIFTDQKIGDPMTIAMSEENAEQWFGKAPPDLSLIGRSRGADWVYNYMLGFYRDANGGWNNTVLENASMPHVFWQLQGIQEPVYKTVNENGIERQVVDHLELVEPGSLSPEAYDDSMRDLAAFIDYLGEPAQLKRKKIGVWVMLYLALFAFLAYLLKLEYWRDVH